MKKLLACVLATGSVFAGPHDSVSQQYTLNNRAEYNKYDQNQYYNKYDQNQYYNKYDQNYQLNAQQNTHNTVNQVFITPQAQATPEDQLKAQQLKNAETVAGLLILIGMAVALTVTNRFVKIAASFAFCAGCVEAARIDQEKSNNKNNNLDNAVTDTDSKQSKSALALEGAPKPLALQDAPKPLALKNAPQASAPLALADKA